MKRIALLALLLILSTVLVTYAQNQFFDQIWFIDSGMRGCDTLDTDASGMIICGTDSDTPEVNDLSSVVTWTNVPDANITESSVTQHETALTITESQISDLAHDGEGVTNDDAGPYGASYIVPAFDGTDAQKITGITSTVGGAPAGSAILSPGGSYSNIDDQEQPMIFHSRSECLQTVQNTCDAVVARLDSFFRFNTDAAGGVPPGGVEPVTYMSWLLDDAQILRLDRSGNLEAETSDDLYLHEQGSSYVLTGDIEFQDSLTFTQLPSAPSAPGATGRKLYVREAAAGPPSAGTLVVQDDGGNVWYLENQVVDSASAPLPQEPALKFNEGIIVNNDPGVANEIQFDTDFNWTWSGDLVVDGSITFDFPGISEGNILWADGDGKLSHDDSLGFNDAGANSYMNAPTYADIDEPVELYMIENLTSGTVNLLEVGSWELGVKTIEFTIDNDGDMAGSGDLTLGDGTDDLGVCLDLDQLAGDSSVCATGVVLSLTAANINLNGVVGATNLEVSDTSNSMVSALNASTGTAAGFRFGDAGGNVLHEYIATTNTYQTYVGATNTVGTPVAGSLWRKVDDLLNVTTWDGTFSNIWDGAGTFNSGLDHASNSYTNPFIMDDCNLWDDQAGDTRLKCGGSPSSATDGLTVGRKAHGNISFKGNSTSTTISATETYYQITNFDTNGDTEFLADADHTNDHIEVDETGSYIVLLSTSFEGGANNEYHMQAMINNGATAIDSVHISRKIGSGGDVGAAAASGLASLTAGDTVEAWVENHTSSSNVTIVDCSLTVHRIY